MPKIPQYQRERRLTTEAPSTQVNAQSFTAQGENIAQIGRALSAVGQRFEELQDIDQLTKAETDAKKRIMELKTQMSQDPDIWTASGRAKEQLRKIGEDTSKGIVNQLEL